MGLPKCPNGVLPCARLDQLLASLGYGSRREVREWIEAGRVSVRGAPAGDPGCRVEPEEVRIDGEALDHPGELLILLNKPEGLVCSHDAAEGPSIYGLLPERWRRRNPPVTSVGRLDKDTTGLLLLTDVGGAVHRFTSPKHKVPKVYRAQLDREPHRRDVRGRLSERDPGPGRRDIARAPRPRCGCWRRDTWKSFSPRDVTTK